MNRANAATYSGWAGKKLPSRQVLHNRIMMSSATYRFFGNNAGASTRANGMPVDKKFREKGIFGKPGIVVLTDHENGEMHMGVIDDANFGRCFANEIFAHTSERGVFLPGRDINDLISGMCIPADDLKQWDVFNRPNIALFIIPRKIDSDKKTGKITVLPESVVVRESMPWVQGCNKGYNHVAPQGVDGGMRKGFFEGEKLLFAMDSGIGVRPLALDSNYRGVAFANILPADECQVFFEEYAQLPKVDFSKAQQLSFFGMWEGGGKDWAAQLPSFGTQSEVGMGEPAQLFMFGRDCGLPGTPALPGDVIGLAIEQVDTLGNDTPELPDEIISALDALLK
jgi:hypothetical protein